RLQSTVAGLVTELVVDALEAVDVDQEDGQRRPLAAGRRGQRRQLGIDVAAVVEPGEGIRPDEFLELDHPAAEGVVSPLGFYGGMDPGQHGEVVDRWHQE